MYDRQALIDLICARALEFGQFQLASGRQASFYLDCRRVTLDSRGAALVAAGMMEMLLPHWPDAVGGMEVGSVPITSAILTRSAAIGRALRGFFVRRQAKGHGKGRLVEGPVAAGDKVVIVEDVVTTGGSSLQAIDACEQFGLRILSVLAVVDRMEGGGEAFRARGYPFHSLVTIKDLPLNCEL